MLLLFVVFNCAVDVDCESERVYPTLVGINFLPAYPAVLWIL